MKFFSEAETREVTDHSIRTGKLTDGFIKRLNLKNNLNLRIAVYNHDIGKFNIDPDIINKPSKLTQVEFNEVKKHTYYGEQRILQTVLPNKNYSVREISELIKLHHEDVEGTGYYNLTREFIPFNAKIIRIVDMYDALRSKRCYKDSFSVTESLYNMRYSFDKIDEEIFKEFKNYILELEGKSNEQFTKKAIG